MTGAPRDQGSGLASAAPGALPHARGLASREGALRRWLLANTFAPTWLPGRWRHPLVGYLLAVLLVLAAVGVDGALAQSLPAFAFSGLVPILAIAAVALSWGAGPSLLATILGAFLLYYIVVPPRFTWGF